MALRLILALAFLTFVCAELESDKLWQSYLETPPAVAFAEAANISRRAEELAASLNDVRLGELDVVVSGGGNFDGFYLGVATVRQLLASPAAMVIALFEACPVILQVLDSLERARPTSISRRRWAGVSAGGMMPFELQLKGLNETLLHHLAYGVVQEKYPLELDPAGLVSGERQDHHWRLMSKWMTAKYAQRLSSLDGRVFLGTSCLKWFGVELVIISNYSSPEQAQSAFMSTGTVLELYNGRVCSDGGATTGKNMTPLFQDALRPQLVVSILPEDHHDQPSSLLFKYTLAEMSKLIRNGQDAAVNFLRCGAHRETCWTAQLSVCPKGQAKPDFVCASTTQKFHA